jgi:hypothetical protein
VRTFLTSGWRRYTMAFVVVAASLGVMGAQCQPPKPPAPSPGLATNPTSPDFGNVLVGDIDTLGIEVINNTTGATGPLAVSVQGGDADQFQLVGQGCVGKTLPPGPGSTCSQIVLYQPTKPGRVTSSLVVTASPGGAVTAPLQGTGFEPTRPQPHPLVSLEVDQGQSYDCNPPSPPARCWGILTGSGLQPFSVVHVIGNGRGFTGTHATVTMDGTVSVGLNLPCNVNTVRAQGTAANGTLTDPTQPVNPPDPCPTA